ncbi:MAG: hypothetical protein NTV22_02995, partial [bacterium]|nr:hypothetical protein [bacterium]
MLQFCIRRPPFEKGVGGFCAAALHSTDHRRTSAKREPPLLQQWKNGWLDEWMIGRPKKRNAGILPFETSRGGSPQIRSRRTNLLTVDDWMGGRRKDRAANAKR